MLKFARCLGRGPHPARTLIRKLETLMAQSPTLIPGVWDLQDNKHTTLIFRYVSPNLKHIPVDPMCPLNPFIRRGPAANVEPSPLLLAEPAMS